MVTNLAAIRHPIKCVATSWSCRTRQGDLMPPLDGGVWAKSVQGGAGASGAPRDGTPPLARSPGYQACTCTLSAGLRAIDCLACRPARPP